MSNKFRFRQVSSKVCLNQETSQVLLGEPPKYIYCNGRKPFAAQFSGFINYVVMWSSFIKAIHILLDLLRGQEAKRQSLSR